jgi:predicted enzyme related to lactoylglutathione lyase
MKSAIHWFEIPVADIDRAAAFYESLLGSKLRRETFGGMPYAVFPSEAPGIGGALAQDAQRKPGAATLVYFNTEGKLDAVLARAAAAKATTLLPKTAIGKDGFIAILVDSEGNTFGLHSET